METLLCLFFHFLRWNRNISASWFVPSISEIWSDSIGAHLLLYRQRMVHIPAGISDYCWSLPPDPGVPSEDASQVLFFIISLRCCGSVSDRHCPSVSSSSSKIEAERFPVPPASPVVTLNLRLPMPSTPAPAVGIMSVIRQVTAATLSFSSHPECIGETGHIGLYRIIDCLQRSRHHSCRS